MKKRKILITLIAVFMAFSVFFSQSYLAENIDDLQQSAEALEEEKDDISNQISDADAKIAEKEAELAKLNAQISDVESQVDELNYSIYECNTKIDELNLDIANKQAEIEDDYNTLRNRLKTIYMAGNASDLEIILGAKDFADFIDKTTIVGAVSKFDKQLIDGLRDAITVINQNISEVEVQKAEVVSEKEELDSKRSELDSLKAQNDAATAELQSLKGELTVQYEEISEQQEAYYSQIEAIQAEIAAEEERRRQEEEEKRKQEEANNSSSSGGSSGGDYSGNIPSGGTAADGYPSYGWPAPECTIITSYWGDGRGHQGWDFACYGSAYGRPIVAAASGTVSIANSTDEWGSGWGYHVMVSHGNGFSTLYAHCSQVVVSVGQYVEQGQIIGYIGNTGNSFGAHLHFECWDGSSRYDPALSLGY